MTNAADNIQHVAKGSLSHGWLVFVVVAGTVIGLVLETGIIRVSGFESIHDVNSDIKIFIGLEILCIISQLMILNFVHKKVGKSFLSLNMSRMHIINKGMAVIQLGIIALLLIILFEIALTFAYDLILIKAAFLSSFLTAACMTALLSSR
jgi:hypothetical protein